MQRQSSGDAIPANPEHDSPFVDEPDVVWAPLQIHNDTATGSSDARFNLKEGCCLNCLS